MKKLKNIHPLKEIVVHPSSRRRYAAARGLYKVISSPVAAKLCGAGTISRIGAAYPTCQGGITCSPISFVSAIIEVPRPFIVFEGNPSSRKRFGATGCRGTLLRRGFGG